MNATDDVLLSKWISSRDVQAFAEIVSRHSSMVYATCKRILKRPEDAEDVAQECFVKLLQSSPKAKASLGGWLHTLAVHRSFNRLKQEKRRKMRENHFAENSTESTEPSWSEIQGLVDETIAKLPEKIRHPLIAHILEDQTQVAVGETLGISPSTVHYRINKGIELIRKSLKKRGVQVTAAALTSWLTANTAEAAPVALTAALGKLALASASGIPIPEAKTLIGGTIGQVAGGILAVKKMIAAGLAILAATTALWVVTKEEPTLDPTPIQVPSLASGTMTVGSSPVLANSNLAEVVQEEAPTAISRSLATPSGERSQVIITEFHGPGEIQGIVVDENNRPVTGATVEVCGLEFEYWRVPPGQELRIAVTTDRQGRFQFTNLPASSQNVATSYGVRAFSENQVAYDRVHLTMAGSYAKLTLQLEPSGHISGRVVNALGDPIPEADIYPVPAREREPMDGIALALMNRERNDNDGTFRLDHLYPDEWELVVKAPSYATLSSRPIPISEDNVKLILDAGGSARGRVIHHGTGQPVPGIRLLVRSREHRWDTFLLDTGSDGYYYLPVLQDGLYRTSISQIDEEIFVPCAPRGEEFRVEKAQETTIPTLEVAEGSVIKGRVFDPVSGDGIPDIKLTINIDRTVALSRATTHTGPDGNFQVTGVPKGEHRIRIGNQIQKWTEVTITDDGVVEEIEIPHIYARRLAGVVVDGEGVPVPAALVSVESSENRNVIPLLTNSQGGFEFQGLLPTKDLLIEAKTNHFRSETQGPLTLPSAGVEGIVLAFTESRNASISGIAVDSSGRPFPTARIIASPVSPSVSRGGGADARSNGTFEIARLTAGTYRLQLVPPEQRTWNPNKEDLRVEVGPGEAVTGVKLVYNPEGIFTITGQVLDTKNNPIEDAWVFASGPTSKSTRTDERGVYHLADLDEGFYYLDASHREFSMERLSNVAAGSKNVDFILQGLGAVSGRVVRADNGQPVKEFELSHRPGEYYFLRTEDANRGDFKTFRSDDGTFLLENIPVGPRTVIARAPGLLPGYATMPDIVEGNTTDNITIRLEAGQRLEGLVAEADGTPISGVEIFLGHVNHLASPERTESVARTNLEGTFEVEGISADVRILTAVHLKYAPAVAPIYFDRSGKPAPVNIVLNQGGSIEGTFRANGNPVPSSYISIEYPGQPELPETQTQTGSDGFYRIGEIVPGEVQAKAHFRIQEDNPRNRWIVSKPTVVKVGKVTKLDFDFSPGTSVIEGVVTINGETPVGYSVWIFVTTDYGQASSRAIIDPDGYYRAENVPSGIATVRYGSRADKQYTFEIGEGELVQQDIVFSGQGTVIPEVRGWQEGESVRIYLLAGDVSAPLVNSDGIKVLTEESINRIQLSSHSYPSFPFRNLEPGTYTVIAIAAKSWTEEGMLESRLITDLVTVDNDEVTILLDLAN